MSFSKFLTMENPFDSDRHHRRSIRMKNYDYAGEGLYFITICVNHHRCLLGRIENGVMIPNAAGTMMETEWLKMPERFPYTVLQEHVLMPNHFHGIVEILESPLCACSSDTCTCSTPPSKRAALGEMVGAFKSIVTGEYIKGVKELGWPRFAGKLLQRNYWEHTIRSWDAFFNISYYININPKKWKQDRFFREE